MGIFFLFSDPGRADDCGHSMKVIAGELFNLLSRGGGGRKVSGT